MRFLDAPVEIDKMKLAAFHDIVYHIRLHEADAVALIAFRWKQFFQQKKVKVRRAVIHGEEIEAPRDEARYALHAVEIFIIGNLILTEILLRACPVERALFPEIRAIAVPEACHLRVQGRNLLLCIACLIELCQMFPMIFRYDEFNERTVGTLEKAAGKYGK